MAKTIVTSIRISPGLWARVEYYAKLDGVSPNACVVRFLDETFPEFKPPTVNVLPAPHRARAPKEKSAVRKVIKAASPDEVPGVFRASDLLTGPVKSKPGERLKKK